MHGDIDYDTDRVKHELAKCVIENDNDAFDKSLLTHEGLTHLAMSREVGKHPYGLNLKLFVRGFEDVRMANLEDLSAES